MEEKKTFLPIFWISKRLIRRLSGHVLVSILVDECHRVEGSLPARFSLSNAPTNLIDMNLIGEHRFAVFWICSSISAFISLIFFSLFFVSILMFAFPFAAK